MTYQLSQAYVQSRLNYDANTGIFTWKADPSNNRKDWNRVFAGKRAGAERTGGYRSIWLMGRGWGEHQLAWVYVHGEWPTGHVDHRNGVTSDNRICNLRACSPGENQHNNVIRADNTSGYPGVSFSRSSGKWVARIKLHGKRYHLGAYEDPKVAYRAYLRAKAELHPFNPVPRYTSSHIAQERDDGR